MEQMRQNEAGALTAQAIPQKDVEQACFHALGLIGRNCEYLDQHLAHVGADQQTRQAVNDISAASARLDRTVNEVNPNVFMYLIIKTAVALVLPSQNG